MKKALFVLFIVFVTVFLAAQVLPAFAGNDCAPQAVSVSRKGDLFVKYEDGTIIKFVYIFDVNALPQSEEDVTEVEFSENFAKVYDIDGQEVVAFATILEDGNIYWGMRERDNDDTSDGTGQQSSITVNDDGSFSVIAVWEDQTVTAYIITIGYSMDGETPVNWTVNGEAVRIQKWLEFNQITNPCNSVYFQ